MYYVSAQAIDEHMINVHYCYYASLCFSADVSSLLGGVWECREACCVSLSPWLPRQVSTLHTAVLYWYSTLLRWAWLMWTALVTLCSNGCCLCGQHLTHMAQMGVAYVDSTCHTWLKWAWLMWTALVSHCSNGRGLRGQHLAEEQTNMAVPFCCINSDWPATCTSLQMEIFGHFLHFQTSSCIRWRSLFIG